MRPGVNGSIWNRGQRYQSHQAIEDRTVQQYDDSTALRRRNYRATAYDCGFAKRSSQGVSSEELP